MIIGGIGIEKKIELKEIELELNKIELKEI